MVLLICEKQMELKQRAKSRNDVYKMPGGPAVDLSPRQKKDFEQKKEAYLSSLVFHLYTIHSDHRIPSISIA
jgi:hypothetical protein